MKNINDFNQFRLLKGDQRLITGGNLATCQEASLYACEILGGHTPGGINWHNCVRDSWADCKQLAEA
jgi:hypothetical protein